MCVAVKNKKNKKRGAGGNGLYIYIYIYMGVEETRRERRFVSVYGFLQGPGVGGEGEGGSD